ncbi:hypothetical protein FB45DRAFT_757225, partial [Roridomyces roridus]
PVRYYYLGGFELGSRHHPSDGPRYTNPTVEDPEMFIPEFRLKGGPYDPLAVDVFLLGRMMSEMLDGREESTQRKTRGFNFMRGLLADTMNDDPTKRPKMAEVVRRLDGIKSHLWWRKSQARLARPDANFVTRILRDAAHWVPVGSVGWLGILLVAVVVASRV